MAEWLRRWTRNPLGSPRVGSNPADYDRNPFFNLKELYFYNYCYLSEKSIKRTLQCVRSKVTEPLSDIFKEFYTLLTRLGTKKNS